MLREKFFTYEVGYIDYYPSHPGSRQALRMLI